MATPLEEALTILKNARPDEVRLTRLPTAGAHIEVIPHRPGMGRSRWAVFADEMHRESPLRGQSSQVCAYGREFRERFSFDSE